MQNLSGRLKCIGCCSPGSPNVFLGGREVAPAHQCLQWDRRDTFACLVAGGGRAQTVWILAAGELRLFCLLDSSIDPRAQPRERIVTVGKPLEI